MAGVGRADRVIPIGLEQLNLLLGELDARWRPCGFADRALERRYNDEARPRRARSRIAMFTLAIAVFGLAPIYGPLLLHTPAEMRQLFRLVELGLIVPMSVVGIVLNWRYPDSRLVSAYTGGVSLGFFGLLIMLRYAGVTAGFAIPFETVAIALIVVTLMSGLRSWMTLGGLLIAAAALLAAEAAYNGIGERFWWSVVATVVTCVFAAFTEISLDQSTRRAWITRQVAELSGMRDGLTGLPNRAWFERDAARVLAQARREQVPVSVILLDVDHFKLLNDSLGHAAGDDCLRRIGALLIERYAQRPLDLRARIGGEEFVVLLYDADLDGARQATEQMVRDVRSLGLPHPGSPLLDVVTISAGLAHGVPAENEDIWRLVARADRALYAAKRGGRNRWCEASEAA
ncbi:GGDEF domain-containing protein [Fontimonas sp. SYSU GA230001]|uniref:GGDEF domain-containing protein n=1 Tax=Fontimonas sp. SYSU GA230001 TaxID=3142450 RepID=UPI0032B45C6F